MLFHLCNMAFYPPVIKKKCTINKKYTIKQEVQL